MKTIPTTYRGMNIKVDKTGCFWTNPNNFLQIGFADDWPECKLSIDKELGTQATSDQPRVTTA